jgi:hypothetical protein
MKVFVLAHINSYDDGIPCYGTINLFTDRQKAIDWLMREYGDEYTSLDDLLVTDEDINNAENNCTSGPYGWQLWEDEIM